VRFVFMSENQNPQIVRCGLIQCSNPINDESRPVAEIQEAMFQKHIPMIEDAGKKRCTNPLFTRDF